MAKGISIGDAVLNVRGDFTEANRGIDKFKGMAEGSLIGSATRIGAAFTAMGAAITGTLGVMVNSAADFQGAMAEVNTLGIEDLGALEDAVKSVSTRFAIDLSDGAKAAYQAISAGATEAETPLLLEKAAIAAKAGITDLTTAIELGTGVTNAFGLELKDVNLVYDKAFIAVKNGVTTFEELSASVGKVAPVMAAAGLSVDDMFGSIAALTKANIGTAEAATSMKAVLAGIIKPTKEAADTAKELGIEFNVAALQSKGLEGFMKELGEAVGGDVEVMSKLFGSVEALNAVLALTGNQAEDFAENMNQMAAAQGATDEAFQAFMDANPAFAFEQLKATLALLSVELGQALLPALIDAARKFIPMIEGVIEWVQNNKELVGTILEVIGKIGLFLAIAGPIILAMAGIASAISSLSVILPAIGVAFAALTGPVGLVVALLVAAGTLILTNWEEIKEGASIIWEGIVAVLSGLWTGIAEVFEFGTNAVKNIFNLWVDWQKAKWNAVKAVFEFAAGIVKSVWGGITGTFQAAADLAKGIFETFTGAVKSFWGGIVDIFHAAVAPIRAGWGAVIGVFQSALDTLGSIANGIIEVVNKPFEAAAAFIDWLFGIFGGGFSGGVGIPLLAHGTTFAPGGPSIIGETGMPELVIGPTVANIAKGSTVLDPRQTQEVLFGGRGGITVSFSYPNAKFDTPEAANFWNKKAVRDLNRTIADQGDDL